MDSEKRHTKQFRVVLFVGDMEEELRDKRAKLAVAKVIEGGGHALLGIDIGLIDLFLKLKIIRVRQTQ